MDVYADFKKAHLLRKIAGSSDAGLKGENKQEILKKTSADLSTSTCCQRFMLCLNSVCCVQHRLTSKTKISFLQLYVKLTFYDKLS